MVRDSSILGWTLNTKELDTNRPGVYNTLSIIMEEQYIIPFQFPKPKTGGTITSFKIINAETGAESEVLTDLRSKGLAMHTYTDFDLVVWPGLYALGTNPGLGVFYFTFTDSDGTYQSERVQFCDTSNLIKLTYYHMTDFDLRSKTNEILRYDGIFKHWIFINANINKPDYITENKAETRKGIDFYYQQVNYKVHKFTFLGTEAHMDHIRLIELHDRVEITFRDTEYSVDSFMPTAEWDEEYGDLVDINCEFRTDTVAVNNGKAITGTDYTPTSVSCLVVDYLTLGEIARTSGDFTNGTFGGDAVNPDEYVIVQENAFAKRLYQFVTGTGWVLVPLSTDGLVIYDADNDLYYFSFGYLITSSIITAVTSLGSDQYEVIGRSFINTTLVIRGQVTTGGTTVLDTIVNDSSPIFTVTVEQASLARVRVEPRSNACQNFADSDWKVISTQGVGYDVIGTSLPVYANVAVE